MWDHRMQVLFICLGNVARSQMAEAYYNHLTHSEEASSAGVLDFTPSKYGHPVKEVVEVMREEGIDVSQQKVKTITEDMVRKSDKVFVMCKKEECPQFLLETNKTTFWEEISDPFETSLGNFRQIRNLVKARVISIIKLRSLEEDIIISSENDRICQLPNWADQLADLTRIAWTGKDGKCYFPYFPLTTKKYWVNEVFEQWKSGELRSWVLLSERQKILAHVALVRKDDYFELGRWVAYPDSPQWAVTDLCKGAMRFADNGNLHIKVETTQAHTSSQFICRQLGLRFAGIGFLAEIDGINWDIIYFDNLPEKDHQPRAGVLGDPLGKEIIFEEKHRKRLQEISTTLTTEWGEEIPPKKFHTLPDLIDPISRIIHLNLVFSRNK